MKEDFYWLADHGFLIAGLALGALILGVALGVEVVVLRSWKQALDTKTFYFIPTVAHVRSPTVKSLDIFWLKWDFVFKFK